ncbi:MAG: hypothetical protein M3R13_11175 [Armatimonadota bacterium]|nr:hypothetical protein [Armatimonadota bacterium]
MSIILTSALAVCMLPGATGSGPAAPERPGDELVLNAVLVHFLSDFSEEAFRFGNKRQKVHMCKRNPTTTGLLDQTLNQARNRNGHSEAIEDVLRRNVGTGFQAKPVSYEELQLDKRVQVSDIEPAKGPFQDWAVYEEFKASFSVYAPGYSKDGGTAVVVAFLEPGRHATGVVYYLKLQDNVWIVKWRSFVWYV